MQLARPFLQVREDLSEEEELLDFCSSESAETIFHVYCSTIARTAVFRL